MEGVPTFLSSKPVIIVVQEPFHESIREDTVPSNKKQSRGHFIDRLRSSFSGQTGPKKKDGLPPKTRFSI